MTVINALDYVAAIQTAKEILSNLGTADQEILVFLASPEDATITFTNAFSETHTLTRKDRQLTLAEADGKGNPRRVALFNEQNYCC